MTRVEIEPDGWPCRYDECPAGLFRSKSGSFALMTEYGGESYLVDSGEAFWGGVSGKELRGALIVQPCRVVTHTGVEEA